MVSLSVSSVTGSVVDEPMVIDDDAIEGADAAGKSSAKTRVGFGALLSHGNIGSGRSILDEAEGTW